MTETMRDYAEKIAPLPFSGSPGDDLLGTFALIWDAFMECGLIAYKGTIIGEPECNEDNLMAMGSSRLTYRWPGEPIEDFQARVVAAWDDWAEAGTTLGIVHQLAKVGLDAELIDNLTWNWDNEFSESRFWVKINLPHPWADRNWNETGLYFGNFNFGATITSEEAEWIKGIVRRFKSAEKKCHAIVIIMDEDFADPDGTWGYMDNRDPNAIYIEL